MITPSSNTVLEPLTIAVTAKLFPRVTTHFTRIEVTAISLESGSLAHFQTERFAHAARLLADASMDVIVWNGTSGAWQGLASDDEVCQAMTQVSGVPSTTATRAQLEAFRLSGIERFALAVPYLSSVRDAIVQTYAAAGFKCCGSATLDISNNAAFADVSADAIRDLVRRADSSAAQALCIICTNLASGWLVEELEQTHQKPVFDSTLVAIWHALRLAGVDDALDGWGSLLSKVHN